MGNHWMSSNTDLQLVKESATEISLIYDASSKTALIGSDAAGYASGPPQRLTLTHDSVNSRYTFENTSTGAIAVFFDFSHTPEVERGRLKTVTSKRWEAAGKNGLAYSYDTDGRVSQITTSNGQACSINFSYDNDRLQQVQVVDPTTSPDTIFKSVDYTYHSTASGHHADAGSEGDLVEVRVRWQSSTDSGGVLSNTRHTQYRYDSDGNLKGVFGDGTIQKMVAAYASVSDPSDLVELADTYNGGTTVDIESYADKWIEYATADDPSTAVDMSHWSAGNQNLTTELGFADRDERGFVTSQRIGAEGCSSCSGAGAATKNYYYLENSSASDDNEVKYVVIEDTIDSADGGLHRLIYGLNPSGRLLRNAYITAPYGTAPDRRYRCSSAKLVLTSVHQTAGEEQKRGRVVESRTPDVHNVSDNADLQDFLDPFDGSSWANDSATLLTDVDGSGAVYCFDYNNDGRRISRKVKRGRDGTEYYLSATEWGDGSGSIDESHLRKKIYAFPTRTILLGDGDYTTLTYAYWGTTDALQSVTTLAPSVPTSENGSGQATATKIWYDEAGRARWSQDGEGYYTYYSYCDETGLPAYTAVDVNPTSLPSGATATHLVQPTDEWGSGVSLTRDSSLPTPVALESTTHYDMQGRATLVVDQRGYRHAIIYEDDRTLSLQYLNVSGIPQATVSYRKENSIGQTIESITISADYTAFSTSGGLPTGFSSEPGQSDFVSWSRYEYDSHGRIKWVDSYHDIPGSGFGTIGTNFTRSATYYDADGTPLAQVAYVEGANTSATVQVQYSKLDAQKRPESTQQWRETGFNFATATLTGIETTAMGKPISHEIRYGTDGKVSATVFYRNATGATSGDYTYVKAYYDFQGRQLGSESYFNNDGTGTPLGPFEVTDFDWMGRETAIGVFDAPPNWATATGGHGDNAYAESTATDRRALYRKKYDALSRVYRTEMVTIDSTNGAVVGALRNNKYYNRRGELVASGDPYGTSTEYAYDGAGRQYQSRTVLEIESTKYSSGAFQYRAPVPEPDLADMSSGNDKVMTLSHTVYNDDGLATESHSFEADYNDTNGLNLAGADCVRTTSHVWYDDRGRLTTAANYGSGDGASTSNVWDFNTAPTYAAGSEPDWTDSAVRSGYLLVTKYGYDDRTSRQNLITSGVRDGTSAVETTSTKTFYDDAGRRTHQVENWQGTYDPAAGTGSASSAADEDRETKWAYNGLSQVTLLTAMNGTESQETKYLYEDTHNASRVTSTIYPDSSDTDSTGTDQVKTAYHLDGAVNTMTDQRGVVRTYAYDDHRRVELDAATTIPSSVYGGSSETDATRSIGSEYDDLGRLITITSYDTATTPGPSNILNQVKHTYHGLIGLLGKTEQSHSGEVTSGTPYFQYVYDQSQTGGLYTDGLRKSQVNYPVVTDAKEKRDYSTSGSYRDRMSRLRTYKLEDGGLRSGTYTHEFNPDWSGSGRLTKLSSYDFGVEINHHDISTSLFSGWDRFGRVIHQEWTRASGGATVDEFEYDYDLAGNRLNRTVPTQSTIDQTYTYDGLSRLQSLDANGTSEDRHWSLDALGNWDELHHNTTGTGTAAEDRTHNKANELTAFTTPIANVDPVHDTAGNMTTMPKPTDLTQSYAAKYDAWNRLVSLGTTASYQYDGLSRRIKRTENGVATHFYYNDKWQVLTETDASGDATAIYLYHPDYVDAVAVRMTSTDHSNGEGEHLYLHDALYNVTAVVEDSSGFPVVERYAYSPYGEATVLDASYTAVSGNASTIDNEYLFTGRRVDAETGIQINRNRYYHQQLGQWGNRDPIGYDGGSDNLVGYASGNPVSYGDPLGLFVTPPTIIRTNYGCTDVTIVPVSPKVRVCIKTEVSGVAHCRPSKNINPLVMYAAQTTALPICCRLSAKVASLGASDSAAAIVMADCMTEALQALDPGMHCGVTRPNPPTPVDPGLPL